MLPTSEMIVSRVTMQTDNNKAALTFSNLSKRFGKLEVDCVDMWTLRK